MARLGNRQSPAGTTPVRTLCDRSNCSTLVRPSKLFDSTPVREFQLTSTTVVLPNDPISGGKHPSRPLLRRTSSLRVAPMSPMLAGIHPPSLLLARTMTEALELPKLLGM